MENNNIKSTEALKRGITVVACLAIQLCVGILYLWSIFKSSVANELNLTSAQSGFVGSLMIFGFVAGNLIGGFVQDKTNPKLSASIGCFLFCSGIMATSFLNANCSFLIYITYSGVAGIGSGFAYASVLSCLQKWFPTRRGFASGLSVSAFSMSTVIFSIVAQALLKIFEATFVFRILAIGFFAITALACIFIKLAPLPQNSPVLQGKTPLQAIKTSGFWFIFFTSFFINALWTTLVPLIKPLGMERGLLESVAVMAVTFSGITNALGRFSMASLSDKVKRSYIMIAMATVTMLCGFLLIFAKGGLFFVVVLISAFSYGGPSAIMPAMSVDLFGSKYSGTNYGLILLSLGLSSVIFTPISDALQSASGGYNLSFILASSVCLVPIVLMALYGKFCLKTKIILDSEAVNQ